MATFSFKLNDDRGQSFSIGEIEYSVGRRSLEIHELEINELYRQQGFGIEMMNQFVEHVESNYHVELIVLFSVDSAVRFYEKIGFERITIGMGETQTNLYGKPIGQPSIKGAQNVKESFTNHVVGNC